MKATIPLALILGGCNYDYAIMESPDEPSSETVVIYQQGTIPSPESSTPDTGEAPADTITADTDTDAPLSEETDEPAVEDTDPVVDTGVPLEVPPDSDEPPPEDTDVELPPDPIPDPPPPVDTEEPPPSDPPPEWSTVYFEDFGDGMAQDWSSFNGGCGAQGVVGDPTSWLATSDWNGARVPVAGLVEEHTRLTVDAQINVATTNAVVRWFSNPAAWNSNDDGGISFYYASAAGPGVYLGGSKVAEYAVTPDVPLTLEIENNGYEYFVSVDGIQITVGSTEGVATMGTGLELHANGRCNQPLLRVYSVQLEIASH